MKLLQTPVLGRDTSTGRHYPGGSLFGGSQSKVCDSASFDHLRRKVSHNLPVCFSMFAGFSSGVLCKGERCERASARCFRRPGLRKATTRSKTLVGAKSELSTKTFLHGRSVRSVRGPRQRSVVLGFVRCCGEASEGAAETGTAQESAADFGTDSSQAPSPPMLPRRLDISQLTLARMALVGTTLVWAANNILVKKLYALGLQPGMVTAARFSLSALVLSPFATWQALRPALSLSLTSFAGNASLALSLRFTTSGRASFFAAMSVAVTPFLEFLLYGSPLRPAFLIASFLCVSGVFLMSRESLMIAHMEHRNAALMGNRVDPHLWGALRGDALALLAAFWFALYTVRLSREAPKHRTEALSSSLRVWTACLATIWASIESCLLGNTDAIIESSKKSLGLPALFYGFAKTLKQMMSALVTRLNGGGIAAYIGLFALALLVIVGAYFQVYGQKRVSSQEAAVLYSLNPIWAGIAGYLFLAETFTLEQVFGGACILLGCVYARRQQQYRQQK